MHTPVSTLIATLLQILLNYIGVVRAAIAQTDVHAAYFFNSIVGISPSLDKITGWLNSLPGDIAVLSLLSLLFIVHSLKGRTLKDKLNRLAFWGWAGVIGITAYGGMIIFENFVCRPLPLQVLPDLHSGQTMNGLHLHSSANQSFPSGHGLAYMFSVFMSIWRYPGMGYLLIAIGAVMLISRLALGLHWLSDMVLGSFPLACLLTAVSYKTPMRKLYYFIRKLLCKLLAQLRLAHS